MRSMMVSNYSSINRNFSPTKGGAGCGNVQDQMLPASSEESMSMYKHLKRPKTVSIIG